MVQSFIINNKIVTLILDEISCDFEKNSCGWYNDLSSQIQWLRKQGGFYFNKTGPFFDHTTFLSTGWFLSFGIFFIKLFKNSNLQKYSCL